LGRSRRLIFAGFYQFREEVLQPPRAGSGGAMVYLCQAARAVRPYAVPAHLLGPARHSPRGRAGDHVEGCRAQAGKGKVPTFDQVNRARLAYKAAEADEAPPRTG
jgi:hypothetical protein